MSNTSEFTNIDLKAARESKKVPRWKLAKEIGVSESTIERWETGEKNPEPDDVGNVEKVLQIHGIWHKWMLSHYDSYRERHTDIPVGNTMTETVVRMKHELSDITPFLNGIERDTLNGEFNEPELWKKFKKEALEAMAAIQQTLDRIPDDI